MACYSGPDHVLSGCQLSGQVSLFTVHRSVDSAMFNFQEHLGGNPIDECSRLAICSADRMNGLTEKLNGRSRMSKDEEEEKEKEPERRRHAKSVFDQGIRLEGLVLKSSCASPKVYADSIDHPCSSRSG